MRASHDLAHCVAREWGSGPRFVAVVEAVEEALDGAAREHLRALSKEYARNKQAIAHRLAPMVERRVRHWSSPIAFDDALQAASEAVLRAVDYYSPAHGPSFEAYALRRVERAVSLVNAEMTTAPAAPEAAPEMETSDNWTSQFAERHASDIASERISWAVSALGPLEAKAIRLRYGLGESAPHSVSNICRELELPRRHTLRLLREATDKVGYLLAAAGVLDFEQGARRFSLTSIPSRPVQTAFPHST